MRNILFLGGTCGVEWLPHTFLATPTAGRKERHDHGVDYHGRGVGGVHGAGVVQRAGARSMQVQCALHSLCCSAAAILQYNRCARCAGAASAGCRHSEQVCEVCRCRCSAGITAGRCVQQGASAVCATQFVLHMLRSCNSTGVRGVLRVQGAGKVSRCAGAGAASAGTAGRCVQTTQGAGAEQRGRQHPARMAAAWATLTIAAPISQPRSRPGAAVAACSPAPPPASANSPGHPSAHACPPRRSLPRVTGRRATRSSSSTGCGGAGGPR